MGISASLSAAITILVLWAKTSRSFPILFWTLPERKLQNKCANAAEGFQPDSLLQTSPTIIRALTGIVHRGRQCTIIDGCLPWPVNDWSLAEIPMMDSKYLTHSFSLTTLIVSSLNCRCHPGAGCTNTNNVCLLHGLQHLMASRGHRRFRTDIAGHYCHYYTIYNFCSKLSDSLAIFYPFPREYRPNLSYV